MATQPRRFATSEAFRTSLEERLKQLSQQRQLDLARLRRMVAFERLLARLFAGDDAETNADPPWLLKGGYAFELRLHDKARATKDVDLALPLPDRIAPNKGNYIQAVRERLQEATARDLEDWFVFLIGEPMAQLDAAPDGGARFPVEVRVANRLFVRFHLDVGLGDVVISPPEWISGHDLLGFAGIPPASVAVLPVDQQFAEKIHAYSLPRGKNQNTRVKDLLDLVLLVDMGLPDPPRVVQAIQATFNKRNTHSIPKTFPQPPDEWERRYASLAEETGANAKTLQEAFALLSTYWDGLEIA